MAEACEEQQTVQVLLVRPNVPAICGSDPVLQLPADAKKARRMTTRALKKQAEALKYRVTAGRIFPC